MNILFEELFGAWCAPYDPDRFPAHLREDPLKAYGQYAFEEGFKLALELAVRSYANQLACQRILSILQPQEEKKRKP